MIVYRTVEGELLVRAVAGEDDQILGLSGVEVAWSPDADSIATASGSRLDITDPSGSRSHSMEDGSVLTALSWSPDGATLAAVELLDPPQNGRVVLIDTNSLNVRSVPGLDEVLIGTKLDWSSDGTQLVLSGFIRGHRGGGIFIGDITGGGFRQIVQGTGYESFDVSPTGDRIAYAVVGESSSDGPICTDGAWKVHVVGTDGDEPTRVTSGEGFESSPVWSPDGEWLAFGRDRPLEGDSGPCGAFSWDSLSIWATRPDGADPHLLVEGTGDVRAWLPEGLS